MLTASSGLAWRDSTGAENIQPMKPNGGLKSLERIHKEPEHVRAAGTREGEAERCHLVLLTSQPQR